MNVYNKDEAVVDARFLTPDQIAALDSELAKELEISGKSDACECKPVSDELVTPTSEKKP